MGSLFLHNKYQRGCQMERKAYLVCDNNYNKSNVVGSIIQCTTLRHIWNDQDFTFQYMNLSLNWLVIHSMSVHFVTFASSGCHKCHKVQPFRIMDPISLSAQDEASFPPSNMKHGCQGKLVSYVHSFSRFSHDACKNMKGSFSKS